MLVCSYRYLQVVSCIEFLASTSLKNACQVLEKPGEVFVLQITWSIAIFQQYYILATPMVSQEYCTDENTGNGHANEMYMHIEMMLVYL